jgi:hypothetical protein
MNIINKIIILILIVIIINIMTNGKLFIVMKNTLNICKNNVETFFLFPNNNKYEYATQKDFPYNYNIQDKSEENDSTKFYYYLDNLITKNVNNYEMIASKINKIPVKMELYNIIINFLYTTFNKSGYLFENINILNEQLYYYENMSGKELEPIIFKTHVSYFGKFLGYMTFHIECYIRYDININSIEIVILNIKLLDRTKNLKIEINKKEHLALIENNKITNKMDEYFNDYFVTNDNTDDLFIKSSKPIVLGSDNVDIDTINSLIPSDIKISNDYESSSNT